MDALQSLFSVAENVAVAGRTDTGVHALGNVVSLDAGGGPPVERTAEALNTLLPDDVAAVAAEEAPSDFHARHSARSRSYRYRIYRRRERSPLEVRRSWWYPRRIDLDALAASADLLLGEHDFRAFTPTETQHDVFLRRVLAASWHERGEHLDFEITADSFLRHMVRTLVGTMLDRRPEEHCPAARRCLPAGRRRHGPALGPVPARRGLLGVAELSARYLDIMERSNGEGHRANGTRQRSSRASHVRRPRSSSDSPSS